MARVFIVLPGGKVKRFSNRFGGGFCWDGKDYYAVNERPAVIRDRLAREEADRYEVDVTAPDGDDNGKS